MEGGAFVEQLRTQAQQQTDLQLVKGNCMNLEIKFLDESLFRDFGLPSRATEGSAAIDLRSAINYQVREDETVDIPTGVAIHIADYNCCGLLFIRSGLSKYVSLANGVGLIDSDYQGEIIARICGRSFCRIRRGDRIAQLLIVPILKIQGISKIEEFADSSKRGEGGFGSTGNL